MSPRPNAEIAAQNRQFLEDAKAAFALVARLHDANPHCAGGPLPGPVDRPALLYMDWDEYLSPEIRDGSEPWTMTSTHWAWSSPSTRELPDNPESPFVHTDYMVKITYHQGGDLEIECGTQDAPEGYDECGVATYEGRRYPGEVWSSGSFLADALAAAFAAPSARRIVEEPRREPEHVEWGGDDRLDDPYADTNW